VHRHIQLQLTVHTRITYLMQSTRDVSGLVDISVYPGKSLLDCRERHGQHVTVADCCYVAPTAVRNIVKVLQICVSCITTTEIGICECDLITRQWFDVCACLVNDYVMAVASNDGCHCK
jgi:hypothetical protein